MPQSAFDLFEALAISGYVSNLLTNVAFNSDASVVTIEVNLSLDQVY